MASLNLGELQRQLKSAYWKLLRFWRLTGKPEVIGLPSDLVPLKALVLTGLADFNVVGEMVSRELQARCHENVTVAVENW